MYPEDYNTNKFHTNVLSIHSTEIVHNVSNQDTDVNTDVHYQNLRKLMALLIVPL